MTITTQQVKLLMKNIKKYPQKVAAARSGMSTKTARKYIKNKKLPSEVKKPHTWSTRKNPFEEDMPLIKTMLTNSPGLQAKTILNYLMREHLKKYTPNQLRTLQRHINAWRAECGEPKAVIFSQDIQPGVQSQSDCTYMNSLNITIGNNPFKHLLFHFILPYSCWESIYICLTESFDNLVAGYEKAVWELGFVAKEHRTDNLTAATKHMGSHREFTTRWLTFITHYGVIPSTNNLGVSHENGSIEKSHDVLKNDVEQQLLLRGHRDFHDTNAYSLFLEEIVSGRNQYRLERLGEEMPRLKALPDRKWHSPEVFRVRVSSGSIVQLLGMPYSVPSRLIHYTLKAYIYPNEIILYYDNKRLQVMPRVYKGQTPIINYRHIIDSLVRKPAAFKHYKYREALFPRHCFRKAYDALITKLPGLADKYYIKLLHLAKISSEQNVAEALDLLLEAERTPTPDAVKSLLDAYKEERRHVTVDEPDLSVYDQLLSNHQHITHEEIH